MLQGRVTFDHDPMAISVRGMMTQIDLMTINADNIANSDVPGYQKKEAVISSFAEHLGWKAIDRVTNTEVGRVVLTNRPLDIALNTKGYFQKLQADGRIEMTRDGRFRLDKDGNLLSNDFLPILSRQGTPIRIPSQVRQLEDIQIKPDGSLSVFNAKTGKIEPVARISVVSEDGSMVDDVDMRQKHVEYSNVVLHEEYVNLVPPRRNFQANRQMFLIHSQALSRLVQEMGRAQ